MLYKRFISQWFQKWLKSLTGSDWCIKAAVLFCLAFVAKIDFIAPQGGWNCGNASLSKFDIPSLISSVLFYIFRLSVFIVTFSKEKKCYIASYDSGNIIALLSTQAMAYGYMSIFFKKNSDTCFFLVITVQTF